MTDGSGIARTAQTAEASTVRHPLGKPGGPGLFGIKGAELPAYIQNVRDGLMKGGQDEDKATQMALGVVANWRDGHDGKGNKVSADVQAAAAKAMAQYDELRAKAKATPPASRAQAADPPALGGCDADGLDGSWDGDLSGLPDLTGLTVDHFRVADAAGDGQPAARRAAAKPGTGARFASLRDALAKKGASDPDALAAWIGSRKYGRGKFAKLAAAARKKEAPAMKRSGPQPYHRDPDETVQCPACGKYNSPDARFCDQCGRQLPDSAFPDGSNTMARSSAGELYRTWPLEDIEIVRSGSYADGRHVRAYAAVFNQVAEIRDLEGHYKEEIDRAAFNDAIEAARPERHGGFWDATCLYNHALTVHGTPAERFSLPLGTPKDISAERKGVLTVTRYAETPLGDEILELVNSGAIRSQSFTGGIIRSSPALAGPGDRYRARNGELTLVRRLQLGLREYGPTPFPAYSGAEILGVRMQLPGSLAEGIPDPADDEEPPAGEADGTGSAPADATSSRSTGNRLYQLRTEELLRQHGIDLPAQ